MTPPHQDRWKNRWTKCLANGHSPLPLPPTTPAQFPHSQPSYTRDNPELSESCKSIHLTPEKEGIMNDQDSVTTALKSLSLGTAAISYGIL